MYENYWKFNRKPFDAAIDLKAYYPSESHQAALLKLRYAIESRAPAALLTGQCGTGKSLLVQLLRRDLSDGYRPFVHLVFPQLSTSEFLSYLADELGAPAGDAAESQKQTDSPKQAVSRIHAHLSENAKAGRHAVIVIDEAHLIDCPRTLEALRLLLNFQHDGRPLCTLLLVGQPLLSATLERCPAFDERLAMKCVLRPLSMDETTGYVKHRLAAVGAPPSVFEEAALSSLHAAAMGIPRRMNRLCDLALLVGFAEEHSAIGQDQIEAVNQELTVACL